MSFEVPEAILASSWTGKFGFFESQFYFSAFFTSNTSFLWKFKVHGCCPVSVEGLEKRILADFSLKSHFLITPSADSSVRNSFSIALKIQTWKLCQKVKPFKLNWKSDSILIRDDVIAKFYADFGVFSHFLAVFA